MQAMPEPARRRARHTSRTLKPRALLLAVAATACGGDGGSGPSIDMQIVTGSYALTTLAFDPQGSLPETDIRAVLNTSVQMILASSGAVQIVYQDPTSGLFTTIGGTYRTTSTGARIDFAAGSPYPSLLLSRQMNFAYDSTAHTLSFSGPSPDGVTRARLVALVPALASEQLLDPVPGTLRVTFTR
jgi:hypothetical protein